jgi:curved DNA-binding protein CbpA
MNDTIDYYSVLGVLPNAEHIVVVAAYRALASRYHPDKWRGDVSQATKRMADINNAYETLGNPEKRKAYDSSRSATYGTFDPKDDEQDQAFDSALLELEQRWQVAVGIFPDLANIRKKLAKTSHKLSFAFVNVMLETKFFSNRNNIADSMESTFLERYFGTNKKIIEFAKELIIMGKKDAVVALNKLVDVLGFEVDPELIKSKIISDFNLFGNQPASNSHKQNSKRIEALKNRVISTRDYDDAKLLLEILGHKVSATGAWNIPYVYHVKLRGINEPPRTFYKYELFVAWVIENFCL